MRAPVQLADAVVVAREKRKVIISRVAVPVSRAVHAKQLACMRATHTSMVCVVHAIQAEIHAAHVWYEFARICNAQQPKSDGNWTRDGSHCNLRSSPRVVHNCSSSSWFEGREMHRDWWCSLVFFRRIDKRTKMVKWLWCGQVSQCRFIYIYFF